MPDECARGGCGVGKERVARLTNQADAVMRRATVELAVAVEGG